MKRFTALFLTCLFVISMTLTGCGKKIDNQSDSNIPSSKSANDAKVTDTAPTVTNKPSDYVINVASFTDEVYKILDKYKELHPDFPYEFKYPSASATDAYQPFLDQILATGGADAPDIYCAESTYVLRYTQGEKCEYAIPYKDLGIDVDNLLKEADIAQYSVDIGTNPDGKVVGLAYVGNGAAFIYRRSIAKSVWGTDDPTTIKDKIGPGWDKFFAAAADLKAKGYHIVSGDGDIWHSIENSADMPWVVDGKLVIDPKREAFFDLAKELKDNGYSNNTLDWSEDWYADMKNTGKNQVFGFFGPAWFINYVLTPNSGGKKIGEGTYGDWAVCEPPVGFYWAGTWVMANKDTKHKDVVGDIIKWMTLDSSDTGLQYYWANGTLLNDTKDAVTSGTVMKKSNGKLDFLGGQNMFDVLDSAGKLANGKNKYQFDEIINTYWRDQVREYTAGKKTKEKAIEDFKKYVKSNLDIVNNKIIN